MWVTPFCCFPVIIGMAGGMKAVCLLEPALAVELVVLLFASVGSLIG